MSLAFDHQRMKETYLHLSKNKEAVSTLAIITLFFFALSLVCLYQSLFLPFMSLQVSTLSPKSPTPIKPRFPLQCTQEQNTTKTCPINHYPTKHNPTTNHSTNATCPSYFRWIHEDLRPWKETGITLDMIQRAQRTAHFRLVILDGKAYVEKYKQSIQTRDMFTLWGILQLLRLYPGKLPDLDLMFDCDDRPVVPSVHFQGPKAGPPPVFRYCSDAASLDIVFPDWSFWGWAEINIKPWSGALKDIKDGNERSEWKDRVPYAYWKGNPFVSPIRKDLMTCNVTDQNDWNARLYIQDWIKESQENFSQSNVGDQCTYRYKIYIEGWAWSVSEKYILACNSMTLLVTPHYHDFFTRNMLPLQHYWPIREASKCKSLKFAVEWGNTHPDKAEAIGKAASRYIHQDTKMENVYDYMFHVLNEYGKLMRFKPSVPDKAVELCAETMACEANGNWRRFMEDSIVLSPADRGPCRLDEGFDGSEVKRFGEEKERVIREVERWEDEYWRRVDERKIG